MSVLVGKRVLVVEDDVKLSQRIATLFEQLTGHPPVVSHCIEDANAAVQDSENDFDLAVVDVMLPETREGFQKIQGLEKKLEVAKNTVKRIGDSQTDPTVLRLRPSAHDWNDVLTSRC